MKQTYVLLIKPARIVSLFFELILIAVLFMALICFTSNAQAQEKFKTATIDDVMAVVQSHKGEVVILNVFASWCPPCVQEAPTFVEFYKKYPPKSGVHLYGISVDDDEKVLLNFIDERSLNFPVFHCGQDFVDYFRIETIPTLLVFDREGNLVDNRIGIVPMNDLIAIMDEYK